MLALGNGLRPKTMCLKILARERNRPEAVTHTLFRLVIVLQLTDYVKNGFV